MALILGMVGQPGITLGVRRKGHHGSSNDVRPLNEIQPRPSPRGSKQSLAPPLTYDSAQRWIGITFL